MEALAVVFAIVVPLLLATLSLRYAWDSRPSFTSSQRNWW